jgi:hypothetical protein
MAGDTICRIGSMTKPIVAACAMTLVEDCTLRLDDSVVDLLPELADVVRVLDRCLPGDRRLTAGAEIAKAGGGIHTRRPETGPSPGWRRDRPARRPAALCAALPRHQGAIGRLAVYGAAWEGLAVVWERPAVGSVTG